MKAIVSLGFVLVSTLAFAIGGRPGGGSGPGGSGGGGGGSQPGGGGNQPEQPSGGSSFVYDTFLTDSTNVNGCIVYGNLLTGYVAGQSTVTIPATVTAIVDGAFAGNETVTNIDASAATGLAAVPDSFAAGCGSLAAVTLPSTVTTVGDSAFTMDSSLAAFTGSGVTKVGDYAFFGCTSLVMSDSTVYETTGTAAFTGVSLTSNGTDSYAAEVAPLVTWIKSLPASEDKPSYNTEAIRTWLTSDVSNLENYLYAEEFATNATFKALSVSGTNFLFTAQDLATLSVAHAALQVSTDLANWKTVSESDIVDGVYSMPSTTNGFARIIYTLLW